jgi:hypothetical protein
MINSSFSFSWQQHKPMLCLLCWPKYVNNSNCLRKATTNLVKGKSTYISTSCNLINNNEKHSVIDKIRETLLLNVTTIDADSIQALATTRLERNSGELQLDVTLDDINIVLKVIIVFVGGCCLLLINDNSEMRRKSRWQSCRWTSLVMAPM